MVKRSPPLRPNLNLDSTEIVNTVFSSPPHLCQQYLCSQIGGGTEVDNAPLSSVCQRRYSYFAVIRSVAITAAVTSSIFYFLRQGSRQIVHAISTQSTVIPKFSRFNGTRSLELYTIAPSHGHGGDVPKTSTSISSRLPAMPGQEKEVRRGPAELFEV